jgi:hypothetical protein
MTRRRYSLEATTRPSLPRRNTVPMVSSHAFGPTWRLSPALVQHTLAFIHGLNLDHPIPAFSSAASPSTYPVNSIFLLQSQLFQ